MDCIDQYAGCRCEWVGTNLIGDLAALQRHPELDRAALGQRIRELSGLDLCQVEPARTAPRLGKGDPVTRRSHDR